MDVLFEMVHSINKHPHVSCIKLFKSGTQLSIGLDLRWYFIWTQNDDHVGNQGTPSCWICQTTHWLMIPCSYISQLLVFPLIFSPWETGFPRIHPNLLSRPFESSPLSLSTVSLFLNSVSSTWKYSFLPHCQSFRSSVFVNNSIVSLIFASALV